MRKGYYRMPMNKKWIYCPICGQKTRVQVRNDTILIQFPLYCPKCKKETLINVKECVTTVIKNEFY